MADVARCGLRWFEHLELKGVDDWVLACSGGRGEMCEQGQKDLWKVCER